MVPGKDSLESAGEAIFNRGSGGIVQRGIGVLEGSYIVTVILLLIFVGGPLLFLIGGSFWSTSPLAESGAFTLSNYIDTYLDPSTYQLWFNTLVIATGTTIWATFLGVGMAWVIARTNTPFRPLLEGTVMLPYMVPSYLLAVAYIFLLSPQIGLANQVFSSLFGFTITIYSFWGIIFVKGISYAPLAFLITNAAFRNFDPSLEEAARMSGAGVFKTLRSVTLPMLAPSVTAAMLLIWTKGLETFSVPAFLGLPADPPIFVFSTRIYNAIGETVPADYGLATALATTLLLVAGVGLYIQRKATGLQEKYTTITGQGYNPTRFDLGKWRWATFGLAIGLLFASVVGPFLILLVSSVSSIWYGELFFMSDSVSFTLENFSNLLAMSDFGNAMLNSFILATVGGFIGMLFSSLISYYVVKVGDDDSSMISSTSGIVDQLAYLPAAVPGLVLATGFLWFILTVPSFGLYGSLWLLILANVVRQLPLGTRTTHGALSQVGSEVEEQARIAGAGWLQTMKDIVFPLINKNFMSGFLLLFMSMIRDLDTSILLYSNESLVLSVMIFNLKLVGQYETLAALGVVMIILVLSVNFIVRYVFDASITD
jgi:iron(III) transport system permease protein